MERIKSLFEVLTQDFADQLPDYVRELGAAAADNEPWPTARACLAAARAIAADHPVLLRLVEAGELFVIAVFVEKTAICGAGSARFFAEAERLLADAAEALAAAGAVYAEVAPTRRGESGRFVAAVERIAATVKGPRGYTIGDLVSVAVREAEKAFGVPL